MGLSQFLDVVHEIDKEDQRSLYFVGLCYMEACSIHHQFQKQELVHQKEEWLQRDKVNPKN